MSASNREVLCALADLPEQGSARLNFAADTHGHGLCVVRRHGQVYAYLNRCPHQRLPLDWVPGQFLDITGERIQCAVHGAQFRIEDGRCLAGPCRGDRLTAVPVYIDGDQLLL